MTFYNFTLDNLRYFGTLKAMGTTNRKLLRMISLQAASSWGDRLRFGRRRRVRPGADF